MRSSVIALTGSVLILAGSAAGATAQQQVPTTGDTALQQPLGSDPATMQQRSDDTSRPGMLGHRMMHPRMATLMVILMDTDGDGALSLEEVQAVHARLFRYADADNDGKLNADELQAFMRSFRPPRDFHRSEHYRHHHREGDGHRWRGDDRGDRRHGRWRGEYEDRWDRRGEGED